MTCNAHLALPSLIDIFLFLLFHWRTPLPETHYFLNPFWAPSSTTCPPTNKCPVTKRATLLALPISTIRATTNPRQNSHIYPRDNMATNVTMSPYWRGLTALRSETLRVAHYLHPIHQNIFRLNFVKTVINSAKCIFPI